jgi:RNA polymerase sigma factor (sigma-70 family)
MPKSLDEAGTFASSAYQHYGAQLHGFLLRRLRRPHEVDDVVQEVFMRLLRVRDREFVRSPRAYLYGIALHVVREFKMRDERAGAWVTSAPEEVARQMESAGAITDELSDRLGMQRQLEQALACVPAAHRKVFLLHERDGYSYEEIAGMLRISVHTVDKYLVEAKVRLRAAWVRP